MTAQVALFEQPQQLPAYLKTSEAAKALALQMEGGLAGQAINRISLRNGKFRFNKGGVEVGVHRGEHLDVVIVAANPAVGRVFYMKAFDADATGERPDCYSMDGKTPEADSPALQSATCALCPQNAANSSRTGKGKACSYKKRIVVTSDTAIGGDAYALDVAAMGLFGDDDPPQRLFNLKSYIEALKANGLIVPATVTRLSFDDQESVPKLFFTPVRVLTDAEFAQVEARMTDPAIRGMLDDLDNKQEAGKPVGHPTAIMAPAPAPAPVQAPPPAAPAAAAPAAHVPTTRRTRTPKAEQPPAVAPPPQAAPPAPAAPAQGGFGFGAAPAAPAAPPPAPVQAAAPAAPTAPAAPAGGFTIDLDAFDA